MIGANHVKPSIVIATLLASFPVICTATDKILVCVPHHSTSYHPNENLTTRRECADPDNAGAFGCEEILKFDLSELTASNGEYIHKESDELWNTSFRVNRATKQFESRTTHAKRNDWVIRTVFGACEMQNSDFQF